MSLRLLGAAIVLGGAVLLGTQLGPRKPSVPPAVDVRVNATEAATYLREEAKQWQSAAVHLAAESQDVAVYVAEGFALANSILVVGPTGCVVVDVCESLEAAQEVAAALRAVTDKPLVAMVYTHFHSDHTQGATAFLDFNRDPEGPLPVYAHSLTDKLMRGSLGSVAYITFKRAMRQFGTLVHDKGHISSGIGPRLRFNKDAGLGVLTPTHTFDSVLNATLGGVAFHMVHAPGETPDQSVALVALGNGNTVLLAADNIYRAFPNLYAIRGSPHRDVMAWVRSLDTMIDLAADVMVPSHTGVVRGAATVRDILTAYRDAISFVHDQTVRCINFGLTPDEIVQRVQLPPHLRNHPYLKELYGTVAWSVRSIFSGYLGWFSGDAVDLGPLPRSQRGKRLSKLLGGPDKLLAAAQAALDDADWQWALELATDALASEELPTGVADDATAVRVAALHQLAALTPSANGRNYFLTQALEASHDISHLLIPGRRAGATRIRQAPVIDLLDSLRLKLRAEACEDVDKVLLYHLTDIDEVYSIHIRRGVAIVRKGPATREADVEMAMTMATFRDVASQVRSKAVAYAVGDITVKRGSVAALGAFMALFDPVEFS